MFIFGDDRLEGSKGSYAYHVTSNGDDDPPYSISSQIYGTLMPLNTKELKSFVKDLTFPNTFNYALKMKHSAAKVFAVVTSVFLDLATLPIRLTTGLPKALFDARKENNLKRLINDDDGDSYCTCVTHITEFFSIQGDEMGGYIYEEEYSTDGGSENGDVSSESKSPLLRNKLQIISEAFAHVTDVIRGKDASFVEFLSDRVAQMIKEEDILSVDVTEDFEVGKKIVIDFKDPIHMKGTIDKWIGWTKPKAVFELNIREKFILNLNNDHSLTFMTPVEFTVSLLGQSKQTFMTDMAVDVKGKKPFFSYQSTVQDSILHNDEILSIKLEDK